MRRIPKLLYTTIIFWTIMRWLCLLKVRKWFSLLCQWVSAWLCVVGFRCWFPYHHTTYQDWNLSLCNRICSIVSPKPDCYSLTIDLVTYKQICCWNVPTLTETLTAVSSRHICWCVKIHMHLSHEKACFFYSKDCYLNMLYKMFKSQ